MLSMCICVHLWFFNQVCLTLARGLFNALNAYVINPDSRRTEVFVGWAMLTKSLKLRYKEHFEHCPPLPSVSLIYVHLLITLIDYITSLSLAPKQAASKLEDRNRVANLEMLKKFALQLYEQNLSFL
jgi:hypothetical protein